MEKDMVDTRHLEFESALIPRKRKVFKVDENGNTHYFQDYSYSEASRLHVSALSFWTESGHKLPLINENIPLTYIQSQYDNKFKVLKFNQNESSNAVVTNDNSSSCGHSVQVTSGSGKNRKDLYESFVENCQLALLELQQLVCLTKELKSTENIKLQVIASANNNGPSIADMPSIKESFDTNANLPLKQLVNTKKANYVKSFTNISKSLSQLSKQSLLCGVHTQFTIALKKKWKVISDAPSIKTNIRNDSANYDAILVDCSYPTCGIKLLGPVHSKLASFAILPSSSTLSTKYRLELSDIEQSYPLMTLEFSIVCLQPGSSSATQNNANFESYVELASVNSWTLHHDTFDSTENAISAVDISENDDNLQHVESHLHKRQHDSFSRLCFQALKSSFDIGCSTAKNSGELGDAKAVQSSDSLPYKVQWKISSSTFQTLSNSVSNFDVERFIEYNVFGNAKSSTDCASFSSDRGILEICEFDSKSVVSIKLSDSIVFRMALVPLRPDISSLKANQTNCSNSKKSLSRILKNSMLTCEGLLLESLHISSVSALSAMSTSPFAPSVKETIISTIKQENKEQTKPETPDIDILQQQLEVTELFSSVLKAITNGIMSERLKNLANQTTKLFGPLHAVIYSPATESSNMSEASSSSDVSSSENRDDDNRSSHGSIIINGIRSDSSYRNLLLEHTSADPSVEIALFDGSLSITYASNRGTSARKNSSNVVMSSSQSSSTAVTANGSSNSIFASLNLHSQKCLLQQSVMVSHTNSSGATRVFDNLVSLRKHLVLQSVSAVNRWLVSRLHAHSRNLNTPGLVVVSPTDAVMYIYKLSPPPSSAGAAGDSGEEDDDEDDDGGCDNEVTRKSVLQNQILTYVASVRTSVSFQNKDNDISKLNASCAEGSNSSDTNTSGAEVKALTLTFYSHAAHAAAISPPGPSGASLSGSSHKSDIPGGGMSSYQTFRKHLTRLLKDSKDASLKRWQQTHLLTVNVGSKDDTSVSVVIDTSGNIPAQLTTVGRTTRATVDEDTSATIDSNSISSVLVNLTQRIYSAVYV